MANLLNSYSNAEVEHLTAIYQPHSLSDANTTRVLEILPATTPDMSDPISCRLSVVSLDPPAEYEAVSYVWGDPSDTKQILVDGQLFLVRINLWNFLDQMRRDKHSGRLWADAICINQSDVKERSRQVAIMGRIYHNAIQVRVWLGAETGNTGLALRQLAAIDWVSVKRTLSQLKQEERFRDADALLDEARIQHGSIGGSNEVYLIPLLELLELEYWSRIWIVQEYVLALKIMIQCGSNALEGHIFEDALGALENHRRLTLRDLIMDTAQPNDFPGVASSFLLQVLKSQATGNRVRALRSVYMAESSSVDRFALTMARSLDARCADFHDQIYALLPLHSHAAAVIIPDYSKTAWELFHDVAMYFLNRGIFESRDSMREHLVLRELALRFGLSGEDPRVKKILDHFDPGFVRKKRGGLVRFLRRLVVKHLVRTEEW